MAPPQRKLPAGFELAVGAHRGRRVTKPTGEKPFRTRPSRLPSVKITCTHFKCIDSYFLSYFFL